MSIRNKLSKFWFMRPIIYLYEISHTFRSIIYIIYLPNHAYLPLRGKKYVLRLFGGFKNKILSVWFQSLCSINLNGKFSARSDQDQVLSDVYLFGASRCGLDVNKNLLFLSGNPYSSPAKLFENFLIDEEANDLVDVSIEKKRLQIKFLKNEDIKKIAGTTVTAMNPNSNNIYHFFVEALFDLSSAIIQKIPVDNILVDENLLDKYSELIKDICPGINIVKIKKKQVVSVQRLLVFKDINYHYHWERKKFNRGKAFKNESIKKPSYANGKELKGLREILSNTYVKNNLMGNAFETKQILFVRKSTIRNTVNQKELVSFFKGRGEVIDPSAISFYELANKIRKARYIYTQSGAAIVNALFCEGDPTFICWQYIGPEQDLDLYTNFLKCLNCDVTLFPARLVLADSSFVDKNPILGIQAQDPTQADIECPIEMIQSHYLAQNS